MDGFNASNVPIHPQPRNTTGLESEIMPKPIQNNAMMARRAAILRARLGRAVQRFGRFKGAVIRRLSISVGQTSVKMAGARWGRTPAFQILLTSSIPSQEAKFGLGTSGGGGGSPGFVSQRNFFA